MISTLVCLLFLPLAVAVLLMLFRGSAGPTTPRWIALAGSIVTLIVSLSAASQFKALPEKSADSGPVQPRVEARYQWLTLDRTPSGPKAAEQAKSLSFQFYIGVDGISLTLIVLTTILTVSSILISWEAIQDRAAEFYTCLLVLESGLIGVFVSFDLLMFYVFFEFTLIPLFFLVGIWGGPQKKYAAFKFFLYTFAGSLITLVGVVSLVMWVVSNTGLATPFSIPDLARTLQTHHMPDRLQVILFFAMSAGFMIKVPLFPFHTWLPLAHVEAPTAGSVMLAGVLLKLGSYGFLRLCLPFFPYACQEYGAPIIGLLSVIGIIYGSFCALQQRDIKKLVAYSSVAHLGFCMLGMFALNVEGITGSVLQMINHGLSTGALFLLVGMVYERYHTRMLDDLGGLANKLPLIAIGMVFISMASIGLPGLNGFVGEVLSLMGMYKLNVVYAVLGATGVVLGAWYLLTMVQHGFFGPLREPRNLHDPIYDMNVREAAALLPLAALCLWLGVAPGTVIDTIRPDVEAVSRVYHPQTATTAQAPVAAQATVMIGD
jgi:NADH-quinone oxidoreductase subunit M